MAATRIEVEEEIEGDVSKSTDYFFQKLGASIPVVPKEDEGPLFDLQNPPSLPLAVAEISQLIFAAHPSGFCVAKTKDVIDAAKEIKENGKGSCIQELSVVDVPLEQVCILALSTDESTLAAAVSGSRDIHLYGVHSLLNIEVEPAFSCSLDEASHVKDIRWTKKAENSFLVLSNHGKLYHGVLNNPLRYVTDNVDAVEWSVKGRRVAVAKGNSLSILSSRFKEKLCISLSYNSLVSDTGAGYSVKVDSIKWVRSDCIILGCFQLFEDGIEENYFVQVIRSKHGKITDASSNPVVLSFSDLFAGLIDDIVPFGCGPYLFLNYIGQCELAITANRKNTDQHIVLLDWSQGDENDDVTVIDLVEDKWLPRIELQENGDDNLIMGLCINKVSIHGKVKVQLGVQEEKELSPHCILMCLTLEGKLSMMHFASLSSRTSSAEAFASISDEEEDTSTVAPAECDQPKVSSALMEQKFEPVASTPTSQDLKDLNRIDSGELPTEENVKLLDMNGSPTSSLVINQRSQKETVSGNGKLEDSDGQHLQLSSQPSTNLGQSSFKASQPEGPGYTVRDSSKKETQSSLGFGSGLAAFGKSSTGSPLSSNLKHLTKTEDRDGQHIQLSSQQSTNFGQSSNKAMLPQAPGYTVRDTSKLEIQNTVGFGSGTAAFAGKFPTAAPISSDQNNVTKSFQWGQQSLGINESTGLQSASSHSWASGKFTSPNASDVRSPFASMSHIQGKISENNNIIAGSATVPDSFFGKPVTLKDDSGISTSGSYSVRPARSDSQGSSAGVGKIESIPSIRSMQFSSQSSTEFGKSPNSRLYSSKDSSTAGMPSLETSLSKKSGNINEMTRELDALLQAIEEKGGFRDACTVFQKAKVEALEQGIETLSEKCRLWRTLMDERLGEVQNLLDNTVQVLARKVYMEGIVKQASDSQYLDLWNRQKLSPELDLKRRHILNLNQDLTNQLIELERHFNTLELKKFAENERVHAVQRARQSKFGPSRQVESLHSLHSTMISQLAAAEQLSERLSEQMGLLSVDSPAKHQNVKKELFETIGIQYDASFSSPDVKKAGDASSIKKLSLSSGSVGVKDQSRRRQSSAKKSYEPETARRRRDSLDRSWASFEPPKTTVKRMLLEDDKGSQNKSSLNDRQQISPQLGRSALLRPKDRTTPSVSSYPSGDKVGFQDSSLKQASEIQSTLFRWASSPAGPSPSTGMKYPMLQSTGAASASPLSAHQVASVGGKTPSQEARNITTEKQSGGIQYVEKSNNIFNNETKPILRTETNLDQKPSTQTAFPTLAPSFPKKPSETLSSSGMGTLSTISTTGSERHVLSTTKALISESDKNPGAQFSTPPAFSSSSFLTGKSPQSDASIKNQPDEKVASAPAFSISLSSSSSSMINTSSIPSLSLSNSSSTTSSFATFRGSLANKQTVASASSVSSSCPSPIGPSSSSSASPSPIISFSSSSAPLAPIVASSLLSASTSPIVPSSSSSASPLTISSSSFFPLQASTTSSSSSDQVPKTSVSLSSPLPSSNLESLEAEVQPKIDVSADTQAPQVQPGSATAEISSKPSLSSTSAVEIPSPESNVTPQPEQSSTTSSLFSTELPASVTTVGGKNESSDIVATQEDEMEEEAPETSQTTELSLGGLGSFGIGSTPSTSMPKANPFGGSFGNAATSQASSPFSMTVPSGQFRPASFTFQPQQSSQSSQPAQSSQPTHPNAFGSFSGGFGTGPAAQASTPSVFGQPAQVGQGQKALGSVLGAFGQSRQIGSGFGGGGGGGGGFAAAAASSPLGGFSSAATGGGFASVAPTSGGFASLASGGGGFAGAAPGGSGFAGVASGGGGFAAVGSAGGGFGNMASGGGGFAANASAGRGFAGAASGGGFQTAGGGGGGFGTFSSQQGSGFGAGAVGGTGKPSELFTQIRR